jgi:hypothetical protein
VIGVIISRRMATLAELNTVLGTEDAWDLLEILSVDDRNHAIVNQQRD